MELEKEMLAIVYLGAGGIGGKDAGLAFRFRMETARIAGITVNPKGNGLSFDPDAPETFGIHDRYKPHAYEWGRAFVFMEPTALRMELLGRLAEVTGDAERFEKDTAFLFKDGDDAETGEEEPAEAETAAG